MNISNWITILKFRFLLHTKLINGSYLELALGITILTAFDTKKFRFSIFGWTVLLKKKKKNRAHLCIILYYKNDWRDISLSIFEHCATWKKIGSYIRIEIWLGKSFYIEGRHKNKISTYFWCTIFFKKLSLIFVNDLNFLGELIFE